MSLRWRMGFTFGVVLICAFFTFANFVPQEQRVESALLPDGGLRLGLDLQGGIHWVLGVKLEVAEEQELGVLAENLSRAAEQDNFAVVSAEVIEGQLAVTVDSTADAAAVREWASDTAALESVSDDGVLLAYHLNADTLASVRQRGMDQVLEVLRNRITDPIQGIPESVVTRQGDDGVLVQIPGGQIDRARATELLKVTGFLEFKIARDSDQSEALLRARYAEGLPPDTEIAFERDKETNRVLTAYLLDSTPGITGDYLTDARVNFDRQQRPIVEFQFNAEGGQIFAEFTSSNLQEPLAIVLDDRVYSAPTIRGRISARGQIEGRFTSQEAADLAVVLRSGSLPVPVVIEEERTVGPALGADSISRGVRASTLGLIVILVFIVGYYRLSGVYAALALLVNLLGLVGLMSMFEATLTLPGIAGVVLTVGMAVDANVIIFERIREELRASKTPRGAIATGFNKSFWTIMDANITTFFTALVLYEFGSGPIKGFAVTLMVGIFTSVLAALVFTRLLYAIHPGNRQVEALSI